MAKQRMQLKQRGISLIEVIIVTVIVGVLAAIALPSYRQHQFKAERSGAQSSLYQLQIWLEQQFTQNGSYPTTLSCDDCQLSAQYDYAITLSANAPYQLSATPKASSAQQSDECYRFVLNGLAEQSNTDKQGNAVTASCWQ